MQQLIRYIAIVAMSGLLSAPCLGQIVMDAGDSWAHQTVLPVRGYTFELTNSPDRGRVIVEFALGTFGSGELIQCDVFENAVSELPVASATFVGPLSNALLDAPRAWSDRQGAIRLTILAGSVTITNVWMKRLAPSASGLTWDHSTNVTRAPRLQIERSVSPFVRLDWTSFGPYRLEGVEQPGSTNWRTLSSGSSTGLVSTLVGATNPAQFFRIVHP